MSNKPKSGTPTKRQHDVLCFVSDYTSAHGGLAPSQREIGDELGLNKATISEHVKYLLEKGLVRKVEGRSRSLVLTRAGKAFVPEDGGKSEAAAWRQVAEWLHTWARLDARKTGRHVGDLEKLHAKAREA